MRSNFEFLEKTRGPLADLCQTAERNAAVDPRACIMELGSFAEEVTRRVLETEGLPDPMNQLERIRLLQEKELISRQVADILHRLWKNRKDAVQQTQDFSAGFAKIQLINARMLGQWYVRYYGAEPEEEVPEAPRTEPRTEIRFQPEIPDLPEPEREVPAPEPEHPAIPDRTVSDQPKPRISWLKVALAASLLLNAVQAVLWFCS